MFSYIFEIVLINFLYKPCIIYYNFSQINVNLCYVVIYDLITKNKCTLMKFLSQIEKKAYFIKCEPLNNVSFDDFYAFLHSRIKNKFHL